MKSKATQEHYFTKEELEDWIESVGGIGAKIDIPEDAYYLDGEYLYSSSSVFADHPMSGDICGIDPDTRYALHVLFKFRTASGLTYGSPMLWPAMRKKKKWQAPIIPYPKKCKKCGSPSRKCGKITLCSNMKCKERKQLKMFIKNFPVKPVREGIDKTRPIYFMCDKCKTQVIDIYIMESKAWKSCCCWGGLDMLFNGEYDMYYQCKKGIIYITMHNNLPEIQWCKNG